MQNTQRSLSAIMLLLAGLAALAGNASAQTGHFVPGPSAAFGQAFAESFPPLNPSTGYALNPLITFPLTVIPAREGTIEFWARLSGLSSGDQASDISFAGSTGPGVQYYVGIQQNNGLGGGGLSASVGTATDSYGSGLFSQATGSFISSPYTYSSLLGDAEAWHHYALVWNDAGLPSGYRTAIYLDGAPAASAYRLDNGPSILPDLAPYAGQERFGLLPFNRETQGTVTFDNLVIRDVAKSDFSDRFQETPTGNVVLWNRLGSADQVGRSEVGAGGTLVPEPSTYALALLGLAGLGFAARRR